MTDWGESSPRGESAPGRQTMVRGLRIACRNISVSLKDTGPRMAGSAEKDALRRSSTPSRIGVLGTCDCVAQKIRKIPADSRRFSRFYAPWGGKSESQDL
jgi:hypothetical protein